METETAKWFERAGIVISVALLVGLFGLLLADVILRWLRIEFYWGSEAGGLLMAWMMFLALPMVRRRRNHIATDFLVVLLPQGARTCLRMAGHVLMFVYLLCLAWYCAELAYSNWQSDTRFQGILRLPMYAVQCGILVGIVLMLFTEMLLLFEEWRTMRRSRESGE